MDVSHEHCVCGYSEVFVVPFLVIEYTIAAAVLTGCGCCLVTVAQYITIDRSGSSLL